MSRSDVLSGAWHVAIAITAAILVSLYGLAGTASADTLTSGNQLNCDSSSELLLSNDGEYQLACGPDSWEQQNGGNDNMLWEYVGPGGPTGEWISDFDETESTGVGTHVDQRTFLGLGGHAIMQSDGNFVLYSSGGTAEWATNTSSSGGYVNAQDDGNLVVYDSSDTAVWSIY